MAVYYKLGVHVHVRGEGTAWAFRAGPLNTNGSPRRGARAAACAAQENLTSVLCAVPSASLTVITREDVAYDPPSSS